MQKWSESVVTRRRKKKRYETDGRSTTTAKRSTSASGGSDGVNETVRTNTVLRDEKDRVTKTATATDIEVVILMIARTEIAGGIEMTGIVITIVAGGIMTTTTGKETADGIDDRLQFDTRGLVRH